MRLPQAEARYDAPRPAEVGYGSCLQPHGGRSSGRYRGRSTGRLPHGPDRRRLWREVSLCTDGKGRVPGAGGIRDHPTKQARARESVKNLTDLEVAIFADGAEKAGM